MEKQQTQQCIFFFGKKNNSLQNGSPSDGQPVGSSSSSPQWSFCEILGRKPASFLDRPVQLQPSPDAEVKRRLCATLTITRRDKINFYTERAFNNVEHFGLPGSPLWIHFLVKFINSYGVDEVDVIIWLVREPKLMDTESSRMCNMNPKMYTSKGKRGFYNMFNTSSQDVVDSWSLSFKRLEEMELSYAELQDIRKVFENANAYAFEFSAEPATPYRRGQHKSRKYRKKGSYTKRSTKPKSGTTKASPKNDLTDSQSDFEDVESSIKKSEASVPEPGAAPVPLPESALKSAVAAAIAKVQAMKTSDKDKEIEGKPFHLSLRRSAKCGSYNVTQSAPPVPLERQDPMCGNSAAAVKEPASSDSDSSTEVCTKPRPKVKRHPKHSSPSRPWHHQDCPSIRIDLRQLRANDFCDRGGPMQNLSPISCISEDNDFGIEFPFGSYIPTPDAVSESEEEDASNVDDTPPSAGQPFLNWNTLRIDTAGNPAALQILANLEKTIAEIKNSALKSSR